MESTFNKTAKYYLRIPDGTIFGPVDVVMLCSWATDARVIPGCELSVNKENWFPVESLPELRLNWSVQLRDGTVYGPLNLLAIRVLASERSISTGAKLSEKGTGRKAILDDSLIPLLVEEMHQMLAGCGGLMNSLISSLHEAHRATLNEVKELEVKLLDVQTQHEKSQDDSTNLSRRLKEAQSALPPKETMIQQLEKNLAHDQAQSEIRATETASKMALLNEELQSTRQHVTRLSNQLVESQKAAQKTLEETRNALLEESRIALQTKENLIRQLESDLVKLKAQAETQATALNGQEALLEKKMGEAFERNDLLASQLAQAQESYQSLLKESARKELDASAKLKRIEQDIKDSTELVTNTLRDVELRERRLLEMERKSNERGRPFSQSGTVDAKVINAEVIHAEVIHADPSGYMASDRPAAVPGAEKPAAGRRGAKTEKLGVLNNVEARLQKELKHWEVLKQEQKDQKKISPKWF